MRNDLNFFSQYQGTKREKKDDRTIIFAIAAVLVTVIVGTFAWNSINLYKVGKEAEDYKAKLSEQSFIDKVKEIEKTEKKSTLLKSYGTSLTSLTSAIASRTAISTEVLNSVSSTLPTEVSFDSIKIDKNEITIKAISTSRPAIGELEHNLTQLKIVQDVHVGSIVDKDNVFSCDIKCALKDVVKNEDK